MKTVKVTNQLNRQTLEYNFETKEEAADFVFDLCNLYDNSTFTIAIRPEDPR